MKINDVRIKNWQAPGDQWWRGVEARPAEPLIEATLSMTLSWSEYKEMLGRDEKHRDESDASTVAGGVWVADSRILLQVGA